MSSEIDIDPCELDRALVKKGGLYKFMQLAWSHVESAEFVPAWHLEEICKHLEAVSRGECRRLVINVPPGCGKSLTVSVFWPVWEWITRPKRKWMFASFDASLSQRDALKAKGLIQSEWFQARWGYRANAKTLKRRGLTPVGIVTESQEKQNTASIYWSSGGGLRFSTSVGGKSTGWHAHIQVCDDPVKPKDVQGSSKASWTIIKAANEWWANTMASRKADPKDFSRVVIMQRLHELDLAAICIRDGYTLLSLPMELEGEPCKTPWGGDRRTTQGELLCPDRYDLASVRETAKDMGPMVAAAQLQQRPTPSGGTIIKTPWLMKRWKTLPARVRWLMSWDCAFKDLDDSDYVVGQVWAYTLAEFFLVDEVRDQLDFVSTCQALKDLKEKYPQARKILIEDKANGTAVENALRKEVPGIILCNPQGGKTARLNAVSGYFQAGNVYLPEGKPWVGDYVVEISRYPKWPHDDRVDATSQALIHVTGKPKSSLKEAMDRIRAT